MHDATSVSLMLLPGEPHHLRGNVRPPKGLLRRRLLPRGAHA